MHSLQRTVWLLRFIRFVPIRFIFKNTTVTMVSLTLVPLSHRHTQTQSPRVSFYAAFRSLIKRLFHYSFSVVFHSSTLMNIAQRISVNHFSTVRVFNNKCVLKQIDGSHSVLAAYLLNNTKQFWLNFYVISGLIIGWINSLFVQTK